MIIPVHTPENSASVKKDDFILSMQLNLLERALAAWPRRDSPLLEINCGNGDFLPFIWQSGFEAVATEADVTMRRKALELAIPGLEIYAARDDALPFDDDSFDWVILHTRYKENAPLNDCVIQALRVARRGIMLTFWNSGSLPGLWAKFLRKKRAWLDDAPSLGQICQILQFLHIGQPVTFATLWTPDSTWHKKSLISGLNNLFSAFPMGAWCVVRLDFLSQYPVTPLPLRIGNNLAKAEPVLEYANKK